MSPFVELSPTLPVIINVMMIAVIAVKMTICLAPRLGTKHIIIIIYYIIIKYVCK